MATICLARCCDKGVIVRAMSGYKLPEWVRISSGDQMPENERCIEVLDEVLALRG